MKRFLKSRIDANGFRIGALNFIFCSDVFLLKINQQYLHHDFYTDVITFPLNEKPEIIEAEIYISIDRVKENATTQISGGKGMTKESGKDFEMELFRVMFHGVLHLLGFNDKSHKEKQAMRKEEGRWLKCYTEAKKC